MRLTEQERREEYDANLRAYEELRGLRRDAAAWESRTVDYRREAAEQHTHAWSGLQEALIELQAGHRQGWNDLKQAVRDQGAANAEALERGFGRLQRQTADLGSAIVRLLQSIHASLLRVECLLRTIAQGDDYMRFLGLKRNALQLAAAEDWSRASEQALAALQVRDRQGFADDRIERDPQLHLLLAGRILYGTDRTNCASEAARYCETAFSRASVSGEEDDLQAGAEAARLRAFLARVEGDFACSVVWAERGRKMEGVHHATAHLELLVARAFCQEPEELAHEVIGATWLWPGLADRLFSHPATALDSQRFARLQVASGAAVTSFIEESIAVATRYAEAWNHVPTVQALPTIAVAKWAELNRKKSIESACSLAFALIGMVAAADRVNRTEQLTFAATHLRACESAANQARRELLARVKEAEIRVSAAHMALSRPSSPVSDGLGLAVCSVPFALVAGLCSSLLFGQPAVTRVGKFLYGKWRPFSPPFGTVAMGTVALGLAAAVTFTLYTAFQRSAEVRRLREEVASASNTADAARAQLVEAEDAIKGKGDRIHTLLCMHPPSDLDDRFLGRTGDPRIDHGRSRELDIGVRVYAKVEATLKQLAEPGRCLALASAVRQALA
jgi:hypothetical protein